MANRQEKPATSKGERRKSEKNKKLFCSHTATEMEASRRETRISAAHMKKCRISRAKICNSENGSKIC